MLELEDQILLSVLAHTDALFCQRPKQARLLWQLLREFFAEGLPWTSAAVAATDIERKAVSREVAALEKAGKLERSTGRTASRTTRLRLTAQGDALGRYMIDDMTAGDLWPLFERVKKITAASPGKWLLADDLALMIDPNEGGRSTDKAKRADALCKAWQYALPFLVAGWLKINYTPGGCACYWVTEAGRLASCPVEQLPEAPFTEVGQARRFYGRQFKRAMVALEGASLPDEREIAPIPVGPMDWLLPSGD